MNLPDINSHITFLTEADTTNFPNASRLIAINKWYHRIVTMILQSQDEWDFDDYNYTDYAILTTDLVANQQDYVIPFSERVLKIKRLEITYDGSNWVKVEPIDINEISDPTNATSVAGRFFKDSPRYDLNANGIFLYPIPSTSVTGGLKVWWTREIQEFTSGDMSDTTKYPGFDTPFHPMIALGVAFDYALAKSKDNRNALKAELDEYEVRLKKHYSSKQTDRRLDMVPELPNYR